MNRLISRTIGLIIILEIGFFVSNCQKDTENYQTRSVMSPDTLGGDSAVIDYDGNHYQVVRIGNQLWLTENLKVTHYNDGTPITFIEDFNEWATTYDGAYCTYNNDTANKAVYGLLYNWYAVNTGLLAPCGWRIPSDDDWRRLEFELGISDDIYYIYGFRGQSEGAKLAGNPGLWVDGYLEQDQSFGAAKFCGLPSGRRYYDGTFDFINQGAYWWSSTEEDGMYAYRRHIWHELTSISRTGADKQIGFPVRCVKDAGPLDGLPSPSSKYRID